MRLERLELSDFMIGSSSHQIPPFSTMPYPRVIPSLYHLDRVLPDPDSAYSR